MREQNRAEWRRVEALLDGALDLPPSRRPAYLGRACGDDDELRREVEELLAACEGAGSYLEEPALAIERPTVDSPGPREDVLPGRIGPYRVLRELGRGGMGAVLLAERDDGEFSKLVALKIVSPDAPARAQVLTRFRAERQILASLEHPNLARLLDGGTADGLPYFVMEYVEGERIDRYCDAHQLGIDERIRLLLVLCDAVAYAHAQSVLHRDIKPSNVLVTGSGNVKLLDFGIAKVLSPNTDGSSTLTRMGGQPLTPEYASPEQLRGAAATPAMDTYALGVLLHELLTGRHPPRGPGGAAHVSVPGRSREEPESWSECLRLRGTTAAALRRRLLGDLGEILRHALEPEPAGRYGTVAELAADLRREIAGRPVHAGRGAVHRMIPVPLRRHPGVALAFATGVVATIAGLVLRSSGPLHAAGAKPSPVATAAPATPTLAVLPFANLSGDPRQEYLADGMTVELLDALTRVPRLDVLSRSSSFALKGRNLPAQEVGRQLGASHLLEGSVQRDGGRVRVSVQLVDARTERSVWSARYDRTFNDLFGLEDEIGRTVARTLSARLGSLPGGEAAPLARAGTSSPEAHEAYLKGAFFLAKHDEADLHRAQAYFRQALAADSLYALAWAGLGDAWGWLAGVFIAPDSAYPIAERAFHRALALDPTLADVHGNLAWLDVFYYRNWPAAMIEFRKQRELDPTVPSFLWLSFRGRLAEAIPDAARARHRSPLSPTTSDLTSWVYVFAHQYDKAILWAREGLQLDSTYFYGDSPLAQAYLGEGRYAEAIAIYERQSQRQHGWPSAPLVMAYARAGRTAQARRYLAQLLAPGHPRVQPAMIAGAYAYLGERDSAFAWLDRAFAAHDAGVTFLRVYPWFDPLRSDPRFPEMLKRAGL